GRRLEPLDVERGSGWHRREGTVYGWVRAGSGRIEHGTDDAGRAALTAGAFLRVPAGLPHRHVPGTSRSNCWSSSTPTARPTRRAAGRDRRRDRRGQQDRCGTGRAGGTAEVGTGVEVVGPDGPVPAVGSPNLVRETPFPGRIAPVMRVRAAGGAAAGWHHHGENVYFGYAVDGPSETEYGPDGREVARIEMRSSTSRRGGWSTGTPTRPRRPMRGSSGSAAASPGW
ncbi:hypothetical protein BRC93_00705, partial [Halobacteriales archaeon QS_5_70_15]